MASSGLRTRYGAAAALACACAALAGCVDPEERSASWSYIHAAIIAPNCTTSNCHSALSETAGLDFEDREATYTLLTNRQCDEEPDLPRSPYQNFVLAGQPDSSRLVYLLRGDSTYVMPPDVPLPEAEIELIERWILEGAECN